MPRLLFNALAVAWLAATALRGVAAEAVVVVLENERLALRFDARSGAWTGQYEWGQLAFDNHHPGWQDYMRRAAEWGAREFGAMGARVDCGAGGPHLTRIIHTAEG